MSSKSSIIYKDTQLSELFEDISSRIKYLQNVIPNPTNDNYTGTNTSGGTNTIGSGINAGGDSSGAPPCGSDNNDDNNLWQIFPIAFDLDAQMDLAYNGLKTTYMSNHNVTLNNITNYMLYQDLSNQYNAVYANWLTTFNPYNEVNYFAYYDEMMYISSQQGWVNCTVEEILHVVNNTYNQNTYTINANALDINTGKSIGDDNLKDNNDNILQITVDINQDNIPVISGNVNYLNNGSFRVNPNEDTNIVFQLNIKSVSPINIPSPDSSVSVKNSECAKYSYTYNGVLYSACPSAQATSNTTIANSSGCYIWNPIFPKSSGSGGSENDPDTSNSGNSNYGENAEINLDSSNNYVETQNNPSYRSTTRRYASSGR